MAGSFVQRGEPACLSKWARAEMALRCGADAVFELPALFAVRPADAFALGGVGVLDGLGIDALSFGSEDAELPRRIAALKRVESAEFSARVRENLAAGMSHARAWGAAAAEALGVEAERINAPNTVLGAEYLRAVEALGSRMEIAIVPRRGAYHDAALPAGRRAAARRTAPQPAAVTPLPARFASATAIRAALREGRVEEALAFVPRTGARVPRVRRDNARADDLLLARLRAMTEAEIAALPGVGEGLERRVRRLAGAAPSREALLDALKCKRYTRARLSRLLVHALLGVTEALVQRHPLPEYARLIGLREDARPLMGELSRRARLPSSPIPPSLPETRSSPSNAAPPICARCSATVPTSAKPTRDSRTSSCARDGRARKATPPPTKSAERRLMAAPGILFPLACALQAKRCLIRFAKARHSPFSGGSP